MPPHPDLEAEQRHIDRAYDRLDAMRAAAQALMESVLDVGRGGTFQARSERDVIVRTSLHRLESLQIGSEALCFGRINSREGESFHIGRLGVSAEDHEPLVVDWRAPIAEPFYRATGAHPMGLILRRHFATEGRKVVGLEDEIFGDEDSPDGEFTLSGGETLLSALDRSRSGRMRDIVATVQREQDEIIRAPLQGVLVVQGGPGTGKTAVALHRAAYLLYTHRFPLERQGVLVVGPNPVFLRYIEHVLPSLGETGVTLSTVTGLVKGVKAKAEAGLEEQRVKGDRRMAKVLARAVRDRERGLRKDIIVPYGSVNLRVTAEQTRGIAEIIRRRGGPHNARRRQVEQLIARVLGEQLREAGERAERIGLRDGIGKKRGPDDSELFKDVRDDPALADALDRMWPVLKPEELLHDLFGSPALIQSAGRGILSAEEQRLLERPREESLAEIPWTSADLPLLDEARVLLGFRSKKMNERGLVETFGHIIVDEAQDLTPMELRMLNRRSLSSSMTIVGDMGQATGPLAPASWEEVVRQLSPGRSGRIEELTVSYRTPTEVMDLAADVLAVAAPELKPPRAAREVGIQPRFVQSSPGAFVSDAREVVRAELDSVPGGLVGVVAPSRLVGTLISDFVESGLPVAARDDDRLDKAITVLPHGMAKGLEFDSVVVIEPSAIAREASQQLRAIYVAMTRTTKRLTFVNTEALPGPLEEGRGRLAAEV